MSTPLIVQSTAIPYSESKIIHSGVSIPHLISVPEVDIPHKGLVAVIPAFNEELMIGTVVLRTRQYVERVIVVDDGSSDHTTEVAKLAGAEVITLEHNTGKTYALLIGLKKAREMKCNIAVALDASGEHNPQEISRVVGQIVSGKADVVVGSQYLNRNKSLLPHEKFKQMKLDSGSILTDSASSFLAFSRKTLENLDFRSEGPILNQYLFSHLDHLEFKIFEVPVSFKKERKEFSSWGFSPKILAAMPAYNEEMFIAKLILTAQKYVDGVLVVDDASNDTTGQIAKELGALVVRHQKNSGYGAALKTIFETARKLDVESLVILDADGQHNPEDINNLLLALEKCEADVVIGSRFIGGNHKNIPKYRKVGMKILDGATRVAGVSEISDSQSGFRAYGKKAIDVIKLTGNGMSAGSEILMQISDHNLKIAEVPINVRYDIKGTSSENPMVHGIGVLYRIIGLISYRRPLPAFGIPGLTFVLLGIIAGSWAFSEYYTTSRFPYLVSMGSALLLVLGLLLVSVGLILNYLVVFVAEQKNIQ